MLARFSVISMRLEVNTCVCMCLKKKLNEHISRQVFTHSFCKEARLYYIGSLLFLEIIGTCENKRSFFFDIKIVVILLERLSFMNVE